MPGKVATTALRLNLFPIVTQGSLAGSATLGCGPQSLWDWRNMVSCQNDWRRVRHRQHPLLRQREGDEAAAGGTAGFGSAGGDDDELAAVDHVDAGGSITAKGQFSLPENLARFRIKSAKGFVRGGTDKDQTAGRHHGAAVVLRARGWDAAGLQFRIFTQRNFPFDLAGIQVHGVQGTPRRFDGWITFRIQPAPKAR